MQPILGNGWILFGVAPGPIEIKKIPEPFNVVIDDVLFDSDAAHALIARCTIEIESHLFCWIGLVPFTDADVDLTTEHFNCIAIISSNVPVLEGKIEGKKIRYLETDAKVFVYGSVRVSLETEPETPTIKPDY
jgi:hypothetical protein